jgi:hypothetical protein
MSGRILDLVPLVPNTPFGNERNVLLFAYWAAPRKLVQRV